MIDDEMKPIRTMLACRLLDCAPLSFRFDRAKEERGMWDYRSTRVFA
jgi:hypothetical protein